VWACGGAGSLATFPVLGGIETLTIGADQDEPGLRAAEKLGGRWEDAGREVLIAAPPAGDWGD
jgi:putative DNA primase/helicase